MATQHIDHRDVTLEHIFGVHRVEAHRCGADLELLTVDIDNQLGPLGNNWPLVDLVQANKVFDDAIVERHPTPLDVLEVTRREHTVGSTGHFYDVETLV